MIKGFKSLNINGIMLLRLFSLIIIMSFVLWLIGLFVDPIGQQLNLFFLRLGDFWADSTNVTGLVSERDPYHNTNVGIGLGNANQPPLAYFCYYFLANISVVPAGKYLQYYYQPIWTMLFITILSITLILIYEVCVRQVSSQIHLDAVLLSISLCLSYPMLFAIERGNHVIVSMLMVSVFIFYYDNECAWKKEVALICLAIAFGLKLSPAVLAILLIYKQDWKSVCHCIIYSILFLLLPFLFLKGGIFNLFQLITNINIWFSTYYSDFAGTGFVASYVKYAIVFFNSHVIDGKTYSVLLLLKYVTSFLLLLGAFHFEEKWKCVFNVILVLLILPRTSFAYCLLYLFPFTILFFNSMLLNEITIDKIIIFICLLMINFVYRCSLSNFFNYNFAVPVLSLVGLFYSVVGFKTKRHIFPVHLLKNNSII